LRRKSDLRKLEVSWRANRKIQALIEPAEKVDQAEIEQINLQRWLSRQALNLAEHYHARLSYLARHKALETLRRRIEDDFGLVAFEYADVSGQVHCP
jgi:hypothetical protein